MKGENDKL